MSVVLKKGGVNSGRYERGSGVNSQAFQRNPNGNAYSSKKEGTVQPLIKKDFEQSQQIDLKVKLAEQKKNLPYSVSSNNAMVDVNKLSFFDTDEGQKMYKNPDLLTSKIKLRASTSDPTLSQQLKEKAGYSEKPTVVEPADLINGLQPNEQLFMRGIGDTYGTNPLANGYAEEFRTGDYHHGASGIYGVGVYVGSMDRALSYAERTFEPAPNEKNQPIRTLNDTQKGFSKRILTMKIKKGDLRDFESVRKERVTFVTETQKKYKDSTSLKEKQTLRKQLAIAASGIENYCTMVGIRGLYDRSGRLGEPPHAVIYDRRAVTVANNTKTLFDNTNTSDLYELTRYNMDKWQD